MKPIAFAIAFSALLFAPVDDDTKLFLGLFLVMAMLTF